MEVLHILKVIEFDHPTHNFTSLKFCKLFDSSAHSGLLSKDSTRHNSYHPNRIDQPPIAIFELEGRLQLLFQTGQAAVICCCVLIIEAVLSQSPFSIFFGLSILDRFSFVFHPQLTHTSTTVASTFALLAGGHAGGRHLSVFHLLHPNYPPQPEPPRTVSFGSMLNTMKTETPHPPPFFNITLPCHSQGGIQCRPAGFHHLLSPMCLRHMRPLPCAYDLPRPRGRPPPVR